MTLTIGEQTIVLPFTEEDFRFVVGPFIHEDHRAQDNLDYASRSYGKTFNAGLMVGLALGRMAEKHEVLEAMGQQLAKIANDEANRTALREYYREEE